MGVMLNEVFKDADSLSLPVPPDTQARTPIRYGALNAVAITDEGSMELPANTVTGIAQRTGGIGNKAGHTSVKTSGAYHLEVTGEVEGGQVVFIAEDNTLTTTDTGKAFGIALRDKKPGSPTVLVRLIQPGEGGSGGDEITPAAIEAALPERLSHTALVAAFATALVCTGAGIDPTGVTDSSAGIQAKIDEAAANGRVLYVPRGTYRVQNLIIPSYLTIYGAGEDSTVFKLIDGGSGTVMESKDFATLTGTGSDLGVVGVTLSNFTIDGNKANSNGTWGLRKFGYRWRIANVTIKFCKGGGYYSEWGHEPGAGFDDTFMEDLTSNLRVHENSGAFGIQWRGPHDSRFEQTLVYANAGIGVSIEGGSSYHAGGIILDAVHVYGNLSHGVQVISPTNQGASINAATLISESNFGTGLILASNGSVIAAGNFYNNKQGGIEIKQSAAGYTIQAALQNNDGAQLRVTADGGDAMIFVAVYTATAGQSTISGSTQASTMLAIVATGNGTLSPQFKSPGPITASNGMTVSGVAFWADTASLRLPRTASSNSGYTWYDPATGMYAWRDGVANATRLATYQASAGNTSLNTATDAINSGGKYAGKMVWNSTAARPVWASGATATATWVYADGTTAHTPV